MAEDLVEQVKQELRNGVQWEKLSTVVEHIHPSGRRDAAILGVTSEGRYYFDIRDAQLERVAENIKSTIANLKQFNQDTMYFHINQTGMYHLPTGDRYE